MDSYLSLIRYDLPFVKAKAAWNSLCEAAYVSWMLTQSDGSIVKAAELCRSNRSMIQTLIDRYSIDRLANEPKRHDLPIPYHLPLAQAKTTWIGTFEKAYLRNIVTPKDTLSALADRMRFTQTDLRLLLNEHEIEYVDDVLEKKAKLWRRFYNGINFPRSVRAYLYFEGKRTTRDGVRAFARSLGGDSRDDFKTQYTYWNRAQIIMTELEIIKPAYGFGVSVYDWSEEHRPVEFDMALELKQQGLSDREIIARLFPEYKWES